jgi:sphinganine-1-phosphate aldolase
LDKACFYFDIEFRKVHLTKDMQIDLVEMRRQVDSNTICLIASAPDYAFGIFDPVPQIAEIALDNGTNLHVDCCLGSYIVPFTIEAGFTLPYKYDFQVPGVTSISSDPHKYCNGPKGCSVLMFRTKELRRYTFFPVSNWSGGMYVTPTMAGSRSGAVIAGTWAAILKEGSAGFLEQARKLLTAAKNIRTELAKIPEVRVLSNHDTTVVSFTSKHFNCVGLNDLMLQRYRWTL